MMRIVLLGMPGCGKTFTGKKLSEITGIEHIDSDLLIEKNMSLSISEIFKIYGEEEFRRIEHKTVTDLFKIESFILSAGGGLPCFSNLMDLIKQKSISFYIQADISLLVTRLNHKEKQIRPLLYQDSETSLSEYLEKTLNERLFFYKQANFKVSAQNTVEEILSILNFKY